MPEAVCLLDSQLLLEHEKLSTHTSNHFAHEPIRLLAVTLHLTFQEKMVCCITLSCVSL